MSHSVYFGGSRHPQNINPSTIAAVVSTVIKAGQAVHVGCQFGADQAVIKSAGVYQAGTTAPILSVFAVASTLHTAPHSIQWAASTGASVTLSAGGITAPDHVRYLLRSIRAFQGCSQAVFFSPGAGSLAVARECVKASIPVFAFSSGEPARIPSTAGSWSLVSMHSYYAPFSNATAQAYTWQAVQQIQLF